ncbi:MAG: AEC family transporter [Desulfatiglandales bacterium]
MNLFITTFQSVAVLLGIGTLGFWIIRKRIVPGDILGFLSPLALDIALPSLIFVNILRNFSPQESPDWWQLPLWWFFFTAVAAGLTFTTMFISEKKTRREFAVSLFYQNGIFFPLAIIAGIYGSESPYLASLFLFTIFYPAFFFSTYHLFFEKKDRRGLDWKKIIHPVLIVTLAGVIIRLAGVQDIIPSFIISIFTLLGGMTIPLIMIILGGNIYTDFHKKGQLQTIEITKFVILKNIIFPLVFLGILFLVRPAYHIAFLILLQGAVPTITAIPLVTERSGGNRAIVNQFIVVSFIFSLISIPMIVWLFHMFFTLP